MDGRTLSASPRYISPHRGTGITSAEKRSGVRGPDCPRYLHLIPWFSRNVLRVPLAEAFGWAGSASLSASKHGWLYSSLVSKPHPNRADREARWIRWTARPTTAHSECV
jgi:hypothetical protein